MKIAHIINQFPPNVTAGLGRYIAEIAPRMAEGHRLSVFTLNDGRLPAVERAGGVTVHRPRGRIFAAISRRRRLNRTRRLDFALLTLNVVTSNWRYFLRLLSTGRKARPDLVAVHDSTNFLAGLLCHHLLRLPVVFHVHTTEYGVNRRHGTAGAKGLLAAVERWLARVARRIVVPTPEVRDQLAAAGWDRSSIEVVCLGGTFERLLAAGGPDTQALRARAGGLRARLGIGPGDTVLLFVGRIERQKGIYPLLAAMPQITAAVPGLRLVIVGEGDEDGVWRIVTGAGLAGHVRTSGGWVGGEELLEYYEMADACVFPSLFEPFGLVATEAMAMGKPTILGHGFSRIFLGDPARPAARFVRGDDSDDIARAVIELMEDPAARESLAAEGERFVRKQLSWDRTVEETLAVYRGVLDEDRTGTRR
ncbi:glycosyl transferase family 1 [Planobispora rosea]|uniref:Glycosyl transferase family 1 n=1 Tax=Planobispora rosea TaxID=35762 RepID=A0A8J3S0L6_PLARO|nr:glycosyltransferase family 4 protein [Planobispora rosea]GGS56354.1 glycosyl transferase family 1 [Planobispora rosea]GIH83562.1 glycosyl transferase family 1 [Planobispora rosea]